jgi:hypothetical protein
MLVCFQYFAREAAGATAHPVFPAPSVLLEGNFMHRSGAIRAARMRINVQRHYERSEAIHSFFARRKWIASLRSQ